MCLHAPVRLDRPADACDEHVAKDNRLLNDWKAGKYMCHSEWEVGNGP